MLQSAEPMTKALIDFLQSYMNEHHLDQNEFGRQADISSATMSHVMTGKSNRPAKATLEKISAYTKKSYIELCAMLDDRLASDLSEIQSGKPTFSPETRLLLEEFDKMSEVTKKAILALVLSYKR